MGHSRCIFLLLTIMLQAVVVSLVTAQTLQRRGLWDASVSYCADQFGACVSDVLDNGAAENAGLIDGDVIVRINSERLTDYITFARVNRSLRSGDAVDLEVYRSGQLFRVSIELTPAPMDTYDGVDFEYSSLTTPRGYELRTIISKPKGTRGKLPVVFFLKWLTCSPIEGRGPQSGISVVLAELAKAGFLVYRVEHPGTGDSNGPDCSTLDFHTELSIYKAAFKNLKNLDQVDMDNIFLFGYNAGGVLAPMVVNAVPEIQPKGLAVNGTWVRTWNEHILDQQRRVLTYLGTEWKDFNKQMNQFAEFHTEYLVKQRHPKDIVSQSPHLKDQWSYPSFDHQFGDRPVTYYHQMNHLDIPGAWNDIKVPTLIVYNEYDWIVSEEDHQIIYDIVSSNNPDETEFIKVPKTDHLYKYYKDVNLVESFNSNSTTTSPRSYEVLVEWFNKKR